MELIPISEHPDSAKILYDLLAERTPEQSISHKQMPTWEEHLAFVEKMDPNSGELYTRYGLWSLIEVEGKIVGALYVTQRDEVGISVFRAEQRKGYATKAIRMLSDFEVWGATRLLANIAPTNEASRKMFEKLGFRTIQHTLALDAD